MAAHLGNRIPAHSENPRRLAPALPFDEDKPSNRCVNLHREHPRPSLFESDFEKVRPRKWPGFTPPRATALCRRSVAYYCTAAYTWRGTVELAAICSPFAKNLGMPRRGCARRNLSTCFSPRLAGWGEVVAKARYLLILFAQTPAAEDPRRVRLIADVLADFKVAATAQASFGLNPLKSTGAKADRGKKK